LFDADNPELTAGQTVTVQNQDISPKESELQHCETDRI